MLHPFDIGARAYTFGHHVVFGPGAFSVASAEGRTLLAHELIHVAQQAGASTHGELTNVEVAVVARVGSRVSVYDPGVWDFITSMPVKGGWITDNWGMFVDVDVKGLIAYMSGSKKWCKDNAATAWLWHGTTDCWREPAGGNHGLHVPVRPSGLPPRGRSRRVSVPPIPGPGGRATSSRPYVPRPEVFGTAVSRVLRARSPA